MAGEDRAGDCEWRRMAWAGSVALGLGEVLDHGAAARMLDVRGATAAVSYTLDCLHSLQQALLLSMHMLPC